MAMRKFLREATHAKPIFLNSLSPSGNHICYNRAPHFHPTQNRKIKPYRKQRKLRKNRIPPKIHKQRHNFLNHNHNVNTVYGNQCTKLLYRPGKHKRSQPDKSTRPYPTWMIFSIRIRDPSFYSFKTRRHRSTSAICSNHFFFLYQ